MRRTSLSFESLTRLEWSLERWAFDDLLVQTGRNDQDALQVVAASFFGRYEESDEIFMTGVIRWAVVAWESHGLILNFRELDYEWGDRMQNVLGAAIAGRGEAAHVMMRQIFGSREPDPFPTAILVSDRNREGLNSLVMDEMPSFRGILAESVQQAAQHIADQWNLAPG